MLVAEVWRSWKKKRVARARKSERVGTALTTPSASSSLTRAAAALRAWLTWRSRVKRLIWSISSNIWPAMV